ncbi:MAG: DNA ligase [Piscinibacter sp.]
MGIDAYRLSRRHWLALAAAGAALPRPARAALPLLLALEARDEIDPAGWLVSEKYDGVRAFWDGQRLRFRSGGAVAAPDWFLARLPRMPLDGELWLGRGRFDALSGLVRRNSPVDEGWHELHYMVFELPGAAGSFARRSAELARIAAAARWPQLQAVEQAPLGSRQALHDRLQAVIRGGGEGLMLHRADAPYVTGRSPALLKLKPQQDADAVVVAHLPGQGRHAGRLGALRVRCDDGTEFQIGTGFSDAERDNPPPLGSTVTYTHRGRTPQGVPRFASYLRVRPDA